MSDGASMRRSISGKPADLIFIDVPLDATDALETIGALAQSGYPGAVQLMSHRGSAVMDRVRKIGEQKKLRMLPSLKKPFDAAAIQKILLELKIGLPPAQAARIRLDEALEQSLAGNLVRTEDRSSPKEARRRRRGTARASSAIRNSAARLLHAGGESGRSRATGRIWHRHRDAGGAAFRLDRRPSQGSRSISMSRR